MILNNSFAILKNYTEDDDYKYYTELDVDKSLMYQLIYPK